MEWTLVRIGFLDISSGGLHGVGVVFMVLLGAGW
jgi:hypothetical protein